MKTSTITIGGKKYGVAGCYGLEVAFQELANKGIGQVKWQDPGLHPKYVVDLIVAAAFAYYNGRHEDMPLSDDTVMNDATPQELVAAVSEIFKVYGDWSALPAGDTEDEEPSAVDGQKGAPGKGKN